ncbi:MAG TPA: 2OG-Fe(II) oxygenase [Methylocella sp.]|nr:2OG-Fe(II) oxygenase [Methylocella sp.]
MLPAAAAVSSQHQTDYAVIKGRTLAFDELVDESFFAPEKVSELAEAFRNNQPFPHLVFENLFSPALLELIYDEFDDLNSKDWRRLNTVNEVKRGSRPNTRFGHATELYFSIIHSSKFVNFIQKVSGIEGLIPDVTLNNAGMHDIPTGGKFGVHIDFNKHWVTMLDNRLVFITYLNKDWLPEYGGTLELWRAEPRQCEVKVVPAFGRSVLFAHTDRSFHGHPDPVNAPDGRSRRSLAAYFYSNGGLAAGRTTYHTTIFATPGPLTPAQKVAAAIKYVTPPAAIDAWRKLKSLIKR